MRGRTDMNKLKDAIDSALKVICVTLFAFLVLIVIWQVMARQVFSAPSTWSEELSKYVFVWLSFFALTLLFSERAHIAVAFLATKLPQKLQNLVGVIVNILIIAWALLVLTYGGLQAATNAWEQNLTALPVSIGPMYLCMPICGILITLACIYHTVYILKGNEAGIDATDVDAQAALSEYGQEEKK